MDDAAGSQHISIQAEKDYDALIKNDKSETVGLNETHSVTNDFKRHIQRTTLPATRCRAS
jgi:hypothetical protein